MTFLQISCLLIIGAAAVTCTPVLPVISLDKMDMTDACLFICNTCFDEEPKMMMDCVRDVCLSRKESRELAYLWIGRTCKNYHSLESHIFGSINKT